MCQTLFYIPHAVAGVPVFGWGWAVGLWCLFCLGWGAWTMWDARLRKVANPVVWQELIPFALLVAAALVWFAPRMEAQAPDGSLLGLPIRGYGTCLLVGVIAAGGLSAYRARQRGLELEVIYSLGIPLVLLGIAGARLFFVIEYWEDFRRPTWAATLFEILKFTEGGLVVYGSLLGGFAALVWCAWRRQMSVIELADLLAPGVVVGMAIGRIGCLLNGCCYGGVCEGDAWAIHFPRYTSPQQQITSPPYLHQLATGRLHGFQLIADEQGTPVIGAVRPASPAAQAGLTVGQRIRSLQGRAVASREEAERILARSGPEVVLETTEGQKMSWTIGALPEHSLPAHPSQIYSAISSALICLLLLAAEPYLPRTGGVFALWITVYPVLRFLEERIRDDEPGQLGTALTISQWVSLAVLAVAAVFWWYVHRIRSVDRRAV